MLLISIRLSLEEALALEAIIVFMLFDVAEAQERLVLLHLANVIDVLTLHA